MRGGGRGGGAVAVGGAGGWGGGGWRVGAVEGGAGRRRASNAAAAAAAAARAAHGAAQAGRRAGGQAGRLAGSAPEPQRRRPPEAPPPVVAAAAAPGPLHPGGGTGGDAARPARAARAARASTGARARAGSRAGPVACGTSAAPCGRGAWLRRAGQGRGGRGCLLLHLLLLLRHCRHGAAVGAQQQQLPVAELPALVAQPRPRHCLGGQQGRGARGALARRQACLRGAARLHGPQVRRRLARQRRRHDVQRRRDARASCARRRVDGRVGRRSSRACALVAQQQGEGEGGGGGPGRLLSVPVAAVHSSKRQASGVRCRPSGGAHLRRPGPHTRRPCCPAAALGQGQGQGRGRGPAPPPGWSCAAAA
jgi:hypothetical protein